MPLKNREQKLEYLRKYYQNHKERFLKRAKEYYQEHKSEYRIACQKYRENHRELIRKNRRESYKINPNPFKIEQAHRRELGFEPINQPFEKCAAHHLDKILIVYIPVELHSSVWHNVWTGKNMDGINGKVLIWCGQQSIKKNINRNKKNWMGVWFNER